MDYPVIDYNAYMILEYSVYDYLTGTEVPKHSPADDLSIEHKQSWWVR